MTTASTATVLDHTSDAGFRVWGLEFNTQTALVGLVQTADTGQINWATGTRPGINAVAGYEIWRFADSTIYLKIEYGTGSTANAPTMWVTVGTGSNGSGTLTGQLSTRNQFCWGGVPVSTIALYTSRWCANASSFQVSWKETGVGSPANGAFLSVGKTVDGTGASTTTGFAVIRQLGQSIAGGFSKQSVRIAATAQTFTDTTKDFVIPGDPAPTSVLPNGNTQAYQIPINVPDVQPYNWACIVCLAEAVRGGTLVVNMVGSTTHTYISVGQIGTQGFGGNSYTSANYGIAMLWE